MQQPPTALAPEQQHWRRNLFVCVLGSFSTIVAMTLLLPFLPLYVQQLGVQEPAAIARWSGAAYGATFLSAALTAPLWGKLADRYGRKLMLIRASLGMAIAMSLIGMATAPWQLVALRLLAGLLGGYASGSTILVAAQTPKEQTGWALGMLSSGIMAGNVVGPLLGGVLPPLIGIRHTFWLTGAVIFLAFLATTFLLKEAPRQAKKAVQSSSADEKAVNLPVVRLMWLSGMLLIFANMSIEPIITLYVGQFVSGDHAITVTAGLVMAAAALGSILSAPRLGRLADRIGHGRVLIYGLIACALLLIPQAFITAAWQLVVLRFLMGMALGGLMPCVTALIRHNVPQTQVGKMLGYSTSAQYVGQVSGPLFGGFVGGAFGMRPVFLATCVIMALCAVLNARVLRKH
ncbi:MFS transporter [Pantoea phytobeneficialis]|uniref:MFS transporter n=1 Tax=Pantoea phytobeneficialis TaxID=2052056 RepID=A0AAP9H248_9GAMM|nr:MFS transporter [Pantoea phytobeneficialis]MDO6405883.1 MFS transporter [Pantoea phytobeneficialis]QGR05225.1 MFS transporter [Pantoea phytobeneficialis]